MRDRPTPAEIKTFNSATAPQKRKLRLRIIEELEEELGLEELEDQLEEAESKLKTLTSKLSSTKKPTKKLTEEHGEVTREFNTLTEKVEKINKAIKKFFTYFTSSTKDINQAGTMAGLQAKEGTLLYQALRRLSITDSRGSEVNKTTIEDTGIRGKSITVNKPNPDLFKRGKFAEERLATHYNAYLAANPEKADNIKAAIKKISSANDLQKTIERTKKRTEIMKVDYKDFFGIKDMSKKSNRAKIYNFWEGVSNQFTDVENAYEKLIAEAKKSDIFTNLLNDIDSKIKGLEEN